MALSNPDKKVVQTVTGEPIWFWRTDPADNDEDPHDRIVQYFVAAFPVTNSQG